MIEPTDEMVAAFGRIWREQYQFGSATQAEAARAGLAAVLAIVARDYEPRRCDNPSWAGHRCTKPRGHDGGHEHRFSGAVWP